MSHLCIPENQETRERREKPLRTYRRPEIRSLEKQEWIDYMLLYRIKRPHFKDPPNLREDSLALPREKDPYPL